MITKIYWVARLAAYLACFTGIFLSLYHSADADPAFRNRGLALVGAGFVAFFIS